MAAPINPGLQCLMRGFNRTRPMPPVRGQGLALRRDGSVFEVWPGVVAEEAQSQLVVDPRSFGLVCNAVLSHWNARDLNLHVPVRAAVLLVNPAILSAI